MTADESIAALKELLQAQIVAVRRLVEEKDALYTERDHARQKAIDAAFAASEKASARSDENANEWRKGANEWRQAMNDRESKFASRLEMDSEFKSVHLAITGLKELQASSLGKSAGIVSVGTMTATAIAIIASLIAIGSFVFNGRGATQPPQIIYMPAQAGSIVPSTPPQTPPR